MAENSDNTVPPGIALRLKKARNGFWLNVAILTAVLGMIVFFLVLFGPADAAHALVAFGVYLFFFLGFLIKIYEDWQKEKAEILGQNRNSKKPSGVSRPISPTPNTAPTSRIDPQEMTKLRNSGIDAKDE